MKQLFFTPATLVLATVLTATAEPARQSPEEKVLDKWCGSWRSHIVVKPAAWSLKAENVSATLKTEWILDGHFQQTFNQSDEHETRQIHRYDAKSKKYHKWDFNSDGGASFWIGDWNEEFLSMTWEYVDFGVGIKGKIVDRFIRDEKYESTFVMKDSVGNVLLDIRSENTRTKKQGK